MSTKALGEQLKIAREAKGWSVDQAVAATYIKPHYIVALENGDFGALPSAVQVRGFIRTYASALALDPAELFGLLESQQDAEPVEADAGAAAAVAAPAPLASDAEAIFAEIATAITARREMLGLSRDDVHEFTHIPMQYLALIESGNFDGFPSPVQARGMLGNYTEFLEMDSSTVLLRYADALQSRLSARQAEAGDVPGRSASKPRPPRQPLLPLWLRTVLSADILIVLVVSIALIAFFTWGFGRVLATQEALLPAPTAPGVASVLLPTDSPTSTATPEAVPAVGDDAAVEGDGGQEDVAIDELPAANNAPVQLFLTVRQRAYLRVAVDGEEVFAGRVLPGETLSYNGEQSVELLTGNAAAFDVIFNQEPQGVLGLFGEVVTIIYSVDGLITPTATITPTIDPAQITPTVTPTPGVDE